MGGERKRELCFAKRAKHRSDFSSIVLFTLKGERNRQAPGSWYHCTETLNEVISKERRKVTEERAKELNMCHVAPRPERLSRNTSTDFCFFNKCLLCYSFSTYFWSTCYGLGTRESTREGAEMKMGLPPSWSSG